ncbi:MAG: MBL fold metallo-hydrolase [Kangiellaceae bacterium]|nr:MBL fold metallo-hydrolase [Kangiellaceae bacterium]
MKANLSTYNILLLILLGASSLLACKTIEGEYPQTDVSMTLEKLSAHVYYVQGKSGVATDNEGFMSNAAAIVTDKGVVIFDALGTPSLAALLITKLKAITDKPIVKVVVSHYHADHIYGLEVFKNLGAKIIAPDGYLDYLDLPIANQRLNERRNSLAPWVNKTTHLITPDTVIDKFTTFSLGGIDFEINYLGKAHSDGDLTLLVKQYKVLLSGDLIFEGRIPFTGNANTKHWLELLEKLDNSKLTALLPGHGGAVTNPNLAIKSTLNYLKTVRAKMQYAVDEMMSFDEAYESIDWSEFEDIPAFDSAHRINAFGIYLSLEEESME